MVGVRLNLTRSERLLHTGVRWISDAKTANFNLGTDYTINRWLHPFVALSDSSQPPYLGNVSDPYGNAPVVSHGIGGEAGLKLRLADDRLSGSVSYFTRRRRTISTASTAPSPPRSIPWGSTAAVAAAP